MVFKIIEIFAILIAGALAVGIPMLGKSIPALSPEKDVFFIIKAFATGVILATGFIHVLPDAFDSLTSPCLKENPWGNFPFSGFVAMLSAIGTLMVDAYATGYYTRSHFGEAKNVTGGGFVDEERVVEHTGQAHLHTHASHGHTHGSVGSTHDSSASELIRHRVISQVLELGIVVHSVIIGISLGAYEMMRIPRQALSFKNWEWLKLDENAFEMVIPMEAVCLMEL